LRDRGHSALDHALALILAVGGELLLERRQFGKRRIGIDWALAFARRRGGRELPMRRPALALVTSTFVAATVVAPTAGFALVLVRFPALARKALAGRAALVVTWFANRRTFRRSRCGFDRRIAAGFTEIIAAVAPSAAVTLALGTVSGLDRNGSRLNAFLRTVLMAVTAMTAAVMTRPALFRSATGPPDGYHLRNRTIGRCCGAVPASAAAASPLQRSPSLFRAGPAALRRWSFGHWIFCR
jgi:hypothetical protein